MKYWEQIIVTSTILLISFSQDTLKAFNDFKKKQQKVYEIMFFDA